MIIGLSPIIVLSWKNVHKNMFLLCSFMYKFVAHVGVAITEKQLEF